MLPAPLGKAVAQPRAAEDVAEQAPLLLAAAPDGEHVDEQEVGLRDLRDRRIDRRDRADDLGQHARRQVGAAELGVAR